MLNWIKNGTCRSVGPSVDDSPEELPDFKIVPCILEAAKQVRYGRFLFGFMAGKTPYNLVRPVSKHPAFSANNAVWQITGICFPGRTVWNESICPLAKRMAMIADGLLCDQNTDYKLQHFNLSFCCLFCVDQITQKDWMFICISCSSWPRWMRVSRLLVRRWNCYAWGDQERP